MTRPLTARGVKAMLARSRVDASQLTITDDPEVWHDLETGERVTYVKITGPKKARLAAWHALMQHGLVSAPYPDQDYYSRPRGHGQ
jgi:hypothetical protein